MNLKPTNRSPTLPFVLINMAMTADGKIATANRAVHSFGSIRDLRHLYELRATADAVMCGARTVEISRSTLDNGGEPFRRRRLRNGLAEHNLRVLVSGSGSLNPEAEIFQKTFSPIVLLTTARISKGQRQRLEAAGAEVKICGREQINFRGALRWLRTKWNVRCLLCEGGGELNQAMFRADLVDEIHLTICPKIFGGRTAPTIADGPGLPKLKYAKKFDLKSIYAYEAELFTTFSRSISGRRCHVS
ncbi:MAG: dihydrofolate reductase family protein [Verrucomicrobiota bacterium]|jgi:riboflavin-specific deaminase-like protein